MQFEDNRLNAFLSKALSDDYDARREQARNATDWDILRRLQRATGRFEEAIVEEALERGTRLAPRFVRILENVLDVLEKRPENFVQIDPHGDYVGHHYAVLILGELRSRDTHPLMVRLAMLPAEVLNARCPGLTDELIEALPLTAPDASSLFAVLKNPAGDRDLREAMLFALDRMIRGGRLGREEAIEYYRPLLAGGLEPEMRGPAAVVASNLNGGELAAEIRKIMADSAFDEYYGKKEAAKLRVLVEESLEEPAQEIFPYELVPLDVPQTDRFARFCEEGWWTRSSIDDVG